MSEIPIILLVLIMVLIIVIGIIAGHGIDRLQRSVDALHDEFGERKGQDNG
jgi:hypothetical protein